MKHESKADHLINMKNAYSDMLKAGMNKSSALHDNNPQANEGSDIIDYLLCSYPPARKKSLNGVDLVCFSHLRWDFVFQRPQHLLSRFSKKQRVFFVEEPVFEDIEKPFMAENNCAGGVHVCVPHIPANLSEEETNKIMKTLVDDLINIRGVTEYILWYYTPMSLAFSKHLNPGIVVYDCMDELSHFKGAHPMLLKYEDELFKKADVVFTGGMNLYEYKKNKHHNIHGIPSSIDREHFATCAGSAEPEDQKDIPHPRAGFYGVLDERLNIELVSKLSDLLPDWNFVMIGPVVKIDPATLPKKNNIHYLGGKDYKDLPCYLGGWDVAMLPFALNESTKFISPTKTPEYLAAGKPVVSTSIVDVVNPYGKMGIVHIADQAEDFAAKINKAYAERDDQQLKDKVDKFLSQNSWDKTWQRMHDIICRAYENKNSGDDIILPAAADEEAANIPVNHAGPAQTIPANKTTGKITVRDPWYKTWDYVRNILTGNSVRKDDAFADSVERKINEAHGGTLMFDYLIVGAGFAGSVLAERLAKDSDKKVLIIDKRDHIGGNAFDHFNEDGILVHKYGPHIFHTNSKEVFDYLSLFTKWRNYEHRVLASVEGQLVPIPINLDTINKLYGFNFNAFELENYFKSVAENKPQILTSEDVVVSKVGRDLYEKFFRGYTLKQWGLDPSQLNASVTARVPTRTNRDDRYFTDTYQAMPLHGYTQMFSKMLNHPNIKVMLNTDYKEIMNLIPYKEMIYTGPIDEFFGFKYGKLPYRSLEFVFETLDMQTFQKVGTINFPNEHKYTRITEFKYLSGQQHPKTTIVYELPQSEGDPYYPVPQKENYDLYSKYEKLARETRPDVYFVGRLATYKYYNMDQVVAQALALYKKIKKNHSSEVEKNENGKPIRENATR